MITVFDDIVRIRKIREDTAARTVRGRERALEDAARAAAAAAEAHRRFAAERPAREAALFEEIRLQLIAMERIETMKGAVAALRERERALEAEAAAAEKARVEAVRALDEARARHLAARRDLEKLHELSAVFREDLMREAERAADLELEEFRAGASADGEDHHEQN